MAHFTVILRKRGPKSDPKMVQKVVKKWSFEGPKNPDFGQKWRFLDQNPQGWSTVGYPKIDPFFGVFWKSAKKPPFSALNLGHLKKVQKKGSKSGVFGGSKNGHFGKTEILLCRRRRFFRFLTVFFCVFLAIFVNF